MDEKALLELSTIRKAILFHAQESKEAHEQLWLREAADCLNQILREQS